MQRNQNELREPPTLRATGILQGIEKKFTIYFHHRFEKLLYL